MASISTLRALPNTQVTFPIEAASAVAGVSGSGDTGGYSAENHQPVAARDQAELSATGTLLARALNVSDVRWDKVTAIRQAITEGTYHVSSEAVAGRLIESLAA